MVRIFKIFYRSGIKVFRSVHYNPFTGPKYMRKVMLLVGNEKSSKVPKLSVELKKTFTVKFKLKLNTKINTSFPMRSEKNWGV